MRIPGFCQNWHRRILFRFLPLHRVLATNNVCITLVQKIGNGPVNFYSLSGSFSGLFFCVRRSGLGQDTSRGRDRRTGQSARPRTRPGQLDARQPARRVAHADQQVRHRALVVAHSARVSCQSNSTHGSVSVRVVRWRRRWHPALGRTASIYLGVDCRSLSQWDRLAPANCVEIERLVTLTQLREPAGGLRDRNRRSVTSLVMPCFNLRETH